MLLSVLHSFVNIFAGGRSTIKVVLFGIYFFTILVIYFFTKNKTFKTPKWKWFGLTIILMYLYGLMLHIFYLVSRKLPLLDFTITGNNGEISSSVIWHTHIAKGIVGEIFYLFGKNQFQTMDAGGAYIDLIPNYIFFFGIILFVIIIIQNIFYFIKFISIAKETNSKRILSFLILGYSITSFSVIKTSIDGGVLDPAFIICIFFIILFFLRQKGRAIFIYYYLIVFLVISLIIFSIYINSFTHGNGLIFTQIATLITLYSILLYGSEKIIRLQFFVPLIILFTASWWMSSVRDQSIYSYSKINLIDNQEIYTYNESTKQVEKIKILNPTSVGQLVVKMNKNISYTPIAVPGVTCMEKAPFRSFSTSIISSKQFNKNSFNKSQFIQINNNDSVRSGENWLTAINISMAPCLPEPLSVIDGELKKNGLNNYVLLNPKFYDNVSNQ